jgi:hypothetical protein
MKKNTLKDDHFTIKCEDSKIKEFSSIHAEASALSPHFHPPKENDQNFFVINLLQCILNLNTYPTKDIQNQSIIGSIRGVQKIVKNHSSAAWSTRTPQHWPYFHCVCEDMGRRYAN